MDKKGELIHSFVILARCCSVVFLTNRGRCSTLLKKEKTSFFSFTDQTRAEQSRAGCCLYCRDAGSASVEHNFARSVIAAGGVEEGFRQARESRSVLFPPVGKRT